MNRRRMVLVALAFGLASAGCVGFGGTPLADEQPTRPPGVDGGVNATALVAAHERSLDGVAVTITTARAEWATLDGRNESVRTHSVTDGNGTLRRTTHTERGGERTAIEVWSDDGGAVRHVGASGRTAPTDPVRTAAARYRTGPLERWLAAGAYELRTVEDGREPRYVLTSTAYTPPEGEPLEADSVQFEAIAVVTGAGRVATLSATLVTVEENKWGRHVRTRTYSYRLVQTGGPGPDRPGWLRSAAPNAEVADG